MKRLATLLRPNVRAELESRGFCFRRRQESPSLPWLEHPHVTELERAFVVWSTKKERDSIVRRAPLDACRSEGARLATYDSREIRAAVPPAKEGEAGANRGAFRRPDDALRAFAARHFARRRLLRERRRERPSCSLDVERAEAGPITCSFERVVIATPFLPCRADPHRKVRTVTAPTDDGTLADGSGRLERGEAFADSFSVSRARPQRRGRLLRP